MLDNMGNKVDKLIYEERIRVLKELLLLNIEFSEEILKDVTGLTEEQILEVKDELRNKV